MIVEQRPGPIDPKEALAQIAYLRNLVEETRIRVADGYREFGMWGIVWIVGYGLSALYYANESASPGPRTGWTWLVLIGLATIGHVILGISSRRRNRATALGRKLLFVNLTIAFAAVGHILLYSKLSIPSSGAFIGFWVGVAYIINGIFIGRELVGIGGWLLVVAIVTRMIEGSAARSIWLAVAGGGSLLLTSLLLYRQSRRHAAVR